MRGPESTGACLQATHEMNPWDSRGRRETTPESCHLNSMCVQWPTHVHTYTNKIQFKKKLSLILSLQFTVSSTGGASLLFKHSRLTPGTEALHQLLPRPHSLGFVPSSPSTKRFSFQPLLRAQPSSSYTKGESWLFTVHLVTATAPDIDKICDQYMQNCCINHK